VASDAPRAAEECGQCGLHNWLRDAHSPTRRNIERAHCVPQAYLQAWADEGDRVSPRRRDRRNASLAMIKDVAADRGLHGLGVAGRGREKLFGGIESS